MPQDTHPGVACLPKPRDHLPFKKMCTIVGWGKRKASDQFGTDILHEAQVKYKVKLYLIIYLGGGENHMISYYESLE